MNVGRRKGCGEVLVTYGAPGGSLVVGIAFKDRPEEGKKKNLRMEYD